MRLPYGQVTCCRPAPKSARWAEAPGKLPKLVSEYSYATARLQLGGERSESSYGPIGTRSAAVRLMQARDIDSSDVTVEVEGAKVLLEGTVPERHMKHAIEDPADACPGVQDIESRIRVRREWRTSGSTRGRGSLLRRA